MGSAEDTLHYPIDEMPEPGDTLLVAPGVQWVRMPLPFALDHINLWLLDDDEDVVVVDTGFAEDVTKRCWDTILDADGRRMSGIVVTHFHPDHLGLATWLAQRDGAPIYMTQGEFLSAAAYWHQLPGYAVGDMVALFRAHGLTEDRLEALEKRGNTYLRGVPELPVAIRRMFEGDTVSVDGDAWRVIVGYGHAPEHASLYCEEKGVLIGGDMLLPRISTNVSVAASMPEDDALAWFLDSLQRIKKLPDDTLVLPSHGRPFHGVHTRVAQLEAHHRERCDVLLDALDQPRTAGELLATLFPRELDNHQLMFAMGEAIAHLNYLSNQRGARRLEAEDGTVRFERTA